jgi:hypothetical protein
VALDNHPAEGEAQLSPREDFEPRAEKLPSEAPGVVRNFGDTSGRSLVRSVRDVLFQFARPSGDSCPAEGAGGLSYGVRTAPPIAASIAANNDASRSGLDK